MKGVLRQIMLLIGVAWALSSCSEALAPESGPYLRALDEHHHLTTRTQAIRPTQGEGFLGNGYAEGVEVRSLPSEGGFVRVWWATSGPDRPAVADADADGVPDLVQSVARVGDEVFTLLKAQGWRQPVSDLTLNDGDNGGDDRFDIYLKDMRAGDGQYIRERCVSAGCAGYIVIENDFRGTSYRSLEEAARVLVSHEYFHAVQSAYTPELEGWLLEGTATWYEEIFYAQQDDFEHLANLYLKEHKRSLNDRNRGPSDAFQYGAALFFYSVSLAHGPEAIKAMLDEIKVDESQVLAVDRALKGLGSSLEAELARFAVFNAFTGALAKTGQGYPQAQVFDEVEVLSLGARDQFNWDVEVEPLGTRYASFEPSSAVTLDWRQARQDQPQPTLSVVSVSEFAQDGRFVTVSPGQLERLDPAKAPYILAVSNPDHRQSLAGRAAVREASAQPPADMGVVDMGQADMGSMLEVIPPKRQEDEGCAMVQPTHNPSGGALCWLGLLGLVWRLGRRGRRLGRGSRD